MTDGKRIFTLAEARALLPQIRALTTVAAEAAASLAAAAERAPDDDALQTRLAREHAALVGDWARDVQALGADVKGLWLVDFDSGDGIYYCWRHPEPDIEFFHDYGAGFSGRRPLGGLQPN